jgi:hypothetical protein
MELWHSYFVIYSLSFESHYLYIGKRFSVILTDRL